MDETKRLYGVLNIRLTGREWLAGPGEGKYSVADINVLPWVNIHAVSGVETLDEFPNVKVLTPVYVRARKMLTYIQVWLERAKARPGTETGLTL